MFCNENEVQRKHFPSLCNQVRSGQIRCFLSCLPWHQVALQALVIPWPPSPPVRETTHMLCQDKKKKKSPLIKQRGVTSLVFQLRVMLFLSQDPQWEDEFGDELAEGKRYHSKAAGKYYAQTSKYRSKLCGGW